MVAQSWSVPYLLSLLPVAILDQRDPVGEVQVEVMQWAVLHAQSAERGTINLSSQILQQKPG